MRRYVPPSVEVIQEDIERRVEDQGGVPRDEQKALGMPAYVRAVAEEIAALWRGGDAGLRGR